MELYHYSAAPRAELLTMELMGAVSGEDRAKAEERRNKYKLIGNYYDSISFFHEPAPIEYLGSYFPKDHRAWVTGREVWEHKIVLPDSIESLIGWRVVELGQAKLLEMIEDHVSDDLYFNIDKYYRHLNGEEGKTMRGLIRAAGKLPPGLLKERYRELVNNKDFERYRNMYAATVPHIMVYTEAPVQVVERKRHVVGDRKFESRAREF